MKKTFEAMEFGIESLDYDEIVQYTETIVRACIKSPYLERPKQTLPIKSFLEKQISYCEPATLHLRARLLRLRAELDEFQEERWSPRVELAGSEI